jgi:hypothetical protein
MVVGMATVAGMVPVLVENANKDRREAENGRSWERRRILRRFT